ncbi:MAG: hypothetical protein ACK5FE_16695 [Cyanobacteriota bacterium]|jgi:hypothetical protein
MAGSTSPRAGLIHTLEPWADLLLVLGIALGTVDTKGVSLGYLCHSLIAAWVLFRCLANGLSSRDDSGRILYYGLVLLVSFTLRALVLDGKDNEYVTTPNSIQDWILVLAGFAIGCRTGLRQWNRFWQMWLLASVVVAAATWGWLRGANVSFLPDLQLGLYWTSMAGYLIGISAIVAAAFLIVRGRPLQTVVAGLALAASLVGLAAAESRASQSFVVLALAVSAGTTALLRNPTAPWLKPFRQNPRRLKQLAHGLLMAASSLGVALWAWITFSNQASFLASIQWLNPSDQGRAILSRCYFGIPFSGGNRFLMGGGFQRSREIYCPSSKTHINDLLGLDPNKTFTHAHNLWAQIAGDSGMLALLVAIFICAALIRFWATALGQLPQSRIASLQRHLIISGAIAVFFFLCSFVHGAVIHSQELLALFGYTLAAPFSLLSRQEAEAEAKAGAEAG